jgi:hypothetical protein
LAAILQEGNPVTKKPKKLLSTGEPADIPGLDRLTEEQLRDLLECAPEVYPLMDEKIASRLSSTRGSK